MIFAASALLPIPRRPVMVTMRIVGSFKHDDGIEFAGTVAEHFDAMRDGDPDHAHLWAASLSIRWSGNGQGQLRRVGDTEELGKVRTVLGSEGAQRVVEAYCGEPTSAFPVVVFGDDADDAGADPYRGAGHARPRRCAGVRGGAGGCHGHLPCTGTPVGERRHRSIRLVHSRKAVPSGRRRRFHRGNPAACTSVTPCRSSSMRPNRAGSTTVGAPGGGTM